MIEKSVGGTSAKVTALVHWKALLQDEITLLSAPGAFHKVLLQQAYALHQNGVIDRDELSDLLEHADGALAYAVEALHGQCDEGI